MHDVHKLWLPACERKRADAAGLTQPTPTVKQHHGLYHQMTLYGVPELDSAGTRPISFKSCDHLDHAAAAYVPRAGYFLSTIGRDACTTSLHLMLMLLQIPNGRHHDTVREKPHHESEGFALPRALGFERATRTGCGAFFSRHWSCLTVHRVSSRSKALILRAHPVLVPA